MLLKATIDIGNTFTKVGFFAQHQLVKVEERLQVSEIPTLLTNEKIQEVIICDVTNQSDELVTLLPPTLPVMRLTYQTPLPLTNHYQTPQTLGMDRLAAVLGATCLYTQQNCLVIDAGSCITYDFVTSDRHYLGGCISLGLQLRFRALHDYTAKLPLLQAHSKIVSPVGTSTADAIQSGVIFGLTEEIRGIINYYQTNFGQLQVVLCGGDAAFLGQQLAPHFPSLITAPYLLLHGLNSLSSFLNKSIPQ